MTAAARSRGRPRSGLPAIGLLLALLPLCLLASPAGWQIAHAAEAAAEPADHPDDENPYRPGVLARYVSSAGGEQFSRVEDEVALAESRPPDARLPAGPFRAAFDARVLVQSPGVHRLRVFAAGKVTLTLAGSRLLAATSATAVWLDAEPVELAFGYQPLHVEYESGDVPPRLALFWEGPGFALEPLAARWLFHERNQAPEDFEHGRQLVRALRCAACHELGDHHKALAAPALDRLQGYISPEWIVARLSASKVAQADTGNTSQSMPHFQLARDEAEAIADFLMSASGDVPPPAKKLSPKPRENEKGKTKSKEEPKLPNAADGVTLAHSLGCLACHKVGELGSDGLFGGGDLSQIAAKRPANFFARWLTDPAALNRSHRMPVFALDALEVANLSLYLESLGKWQPPAPQFEKSRAARGADLVRQHRCGSCHPLPGGEDGPAKSIPLVLTALDRNNTCLDDVDRAKHRPGYHLDSESRQAVTKYLSGIAAAPPARNLFGSDVLAERNCLACHPRGNGRGLVPLLPSIAEADEDLRAALPALAPPSLVGVGDKLRDEALAASIATATAARLSWLRVRMPKFPLTDDEQTALTRHFIDTDRIPERPGVPLPPAASGAEIDGAGARLVTADGFGCTSCHAIGSWAPQKVEPGAEGAQLAGIAQRVRQPWFDRWVRNPVRFVPSMEMPAIVKPVRGVLDENLDRQIAAIWHVLERPDFTPPAPNALRVVRRANLPDLAERAAVLTDVIEVGDAQFAKPLVIGLSNRHNVLYDLATARLAAWWTGDVARQQTRGKTWFWQAGVPQLLPVDQPSPPACELVLVRDGRRVESVPRGQYATQFDTLVHQTDGAEFTHRLDFPWEDKQLATARITQTFQGAKDAAAGGSGGFNRQLIIDGLPPHANAELLVLPGDVAIDSSGRTAQLTIAGTKLRALLRSPEARFVKSKHGAVVELAGANGATPKLECDYLADIVVDQFPPLPTIDRAVARQELHVVPGFEAVRLPLDERCMPTGMAWRGDGTLAVSSLEGRVWLAKDTDGDGADDQCHPFSDDLAAPYGVAAHGDAVDVINKYALLRLHDADRDGFAERIERVASGWGHTADYHDWAVGLVADPDDNYYVALPCEQDDRSEAAANLRGRVLRLIPREPTDDDPRRYSIEEICGGVRFPQGLARSREGQLFASDNQGNYNPFNELNHIVSGARYGFINSLEAKRGLNPPVRPPAIEIPHPWTRSVNGICFLEAPPGCRATSAELFGPLAGQLVGCEYDTRRLVRMSLEQIGGQFQGAVYPFSREPSAGEETFEGPVSCAVSPRGELYIGNLRDSGWGAGTNTGSIVRMRKNGELPAGIAEVRANKSGFTILFAAPVEQTLATDLANYAISSYRRVSTPAYGGPDVDRRQEMICGVTVSSDGRQAAIELAELREGFVYEFHLRKLAGDKILFPDEAYYTLRKKP